jgi:hypothetical protein
MEDNQSQPQNGMKKRASAWRLGFNPEPQAPETLEGLEPGRPVPETRSFKHGLFILQPKHGGQAIHTLAGQRSQEFE